MISQKAIELAEQLIRELGGHPENLCTVLTAGITWIQPGKPAERCPSDGAYNLLSPHPHPWQDAAEVVARFASYVGGGLWDEEYSEALELDCTVRGNRWCLYCREHELAGDEPVEPLYGVRCGSCREKYPFIPQPPLPADWKG